VIGKTFLCGKGICLNYIPVVLDNIIVLASNESR